MEITERDLFNFVFFREKLSVEKADYIESSEMFNEEIEFFASLKEKLADEVPDDIKGKLASGISDYNFVPISENDSSVKKTRRKKSSD
jgi:hypothetical protein